MELTPKEKASEILRQIIIKYEGWNDIGETIEEIKKQCWKRGVKWHGFKPIAYYIIDEIIKAEPTNPSPYDYHETFRDTIDDSIKYWQNVKEELQKL